MKKIIIIALLCCFRLFSQDYDYVHIDLPNLDRMDNFYEFRNEIFPTDLSMNLDHVKNKAAGTQVQLTETVQDGHIIVNHKLGRILILTQSYTKKGIPDGMATLYYSNGNVRQEIPFVKGKAEGIGRANDSDGTLMVETTYKDNKRHGLRRMHSRRGEESIEGNFDNDNVVSKIKVTDRYGKTYIYPPDMKKGIVEVYEHSVKVAEMPVIAEKVVHGELKQFDRQGTLQAIIRYYGGERHGLSEYYKKDGTLLFTNNYSNGRHVGDYKFMLQDGTVLQEGSYDDNGRKTGLWVYRDEAGRIKREENYKNGILEGLQKSYLNGMLTEEMPYIHGKRNGVSKTYDLKTGILTGERSYKDGTEADYKGYYSNGSLFMSYVYNGGKPSTVKYFDPQGNVIAESKYNEKGMPVGEHKLITMNGDSYYINSVTVYDNEGKRTKLLMYNGSDGKSYMETYFDGEVMHGPQTIYNAETKEKTTTWYFQRKKVTEKEFKELSKKKP